jgi:hypothetical protein
MRGKFKKFGIFSIVATTLVVGFALFGLSIHNKRIESEEAEIKSVLKELYQIERMFFDREGKYSDRFDDLRQVEASRPTLVGVFRECNNPASWLPHLFVGPLDERFEVHSRKLMEELINGKCRDFSQGFTGFAMQNLDQDEDLEIWSIDETGKTSILRSDGPP